LTRLEAERLSVAQRGWYKHQEKEPADMQKAQNLPIDSAQATSNIAVDILLTLLTCGIYNFFWQARQMRVVNALLGQERFRFWSWLLLTLITCGIYHIYHEYVMGQAITEVQRDAGKDVDNLALISLLLSAIGLWIVTDAVQQHEINRLFES
jgi:hypothetical protein